MRTSWASMGKKEGRRAVPARLLLAVLLGMLLSLAACGGDPKPLADFFPAQIGALQLAGVVTGEDAMRAVNSLHGRPLDVDDAAVATYAGPGEAEAVVWVSRHSGPAQAREQSAVMIEKMLHPLAGAETPFHSPEHFRSAGVEVYLFQGLGMEHYVFRKQDRVYWIAAPGGDQGQTGGLLLEAMLQGDGG